MKCYSVLLFAILCMSCHQASNNSDQEELHLGEIDINVTGNKKAFNTFKEAMLLLHSFEYVDATEKFQEVQEIDPDFAMAYWGEAMCHNHPLWREQEYNSAREILDKLGETADEQRAKFKTEFEKDMFDAVNILYGSGSKTERDIAYSEHLLTLHEKYPDNDEVAAFYALSILGTVKGGRDFETYAKGANIANSIIAENPSHPGALHYLIHSYDDPENAQKALNAADNYSKVAPDAGHALHMPSHIYVALGMWDKVISSNINSWEASKARKTEKGLDNDALNYHGFKWLMYGYLQQGKFDEARKLVSEMQDYCYEKSSGRSVSHLVMMKAAYFIETNNWNDTLLNDTIDYANHSFYTNAVHEYMLGMAAYHTGDIETILDKSRAISDLINEDTNEALTSSSEMCSGSYSRYTTSQLDLDRAEVLKTELDALALILEGNNDLAEAMLIKAVGMEQKTSYNYGPPEIVKPASELYGEWLIKNKRHDEAKEQFKLVLKRAPGRYIIEQQLKSIESVS